MTAQPAQLVLVLNGGYGVGKSTALDHIGDLMAQQGRAFSLFDADWFHRSWPPTDGDPENASIEAANIAAVWANYRAVGLRQPVLSGAVKSWNDRHRYEEAFGLPVWSILLRAHPAVVETRLRARYAAGRPEALRWHLDRHRELAVQLDAAQVDDAVVDTDALSPREVATQVLHAASLLRI